LNFDKAAYLYVILLKKLETLSFISTIRHLLGLEVLFY
jgi:hypothetical protein